MGRVRGARAPRATTQQTEGGTSEAAAESDRSDSDADSDAAQSEQSQGIVLRGHRLHDVLAALGSRLREVLRQRPSVALDRGCEEVTSHRSLADPQLQQQQLAEPRP